MVVELDSELKIPVSAVAEVLYCPRNFYYRVVEGAEDTNAHVLQGKLEEERRNSRKSLSRTDYRQSRGLFLTSDYLPLTGVVDVVEEKDDQIYPVEYKKGELRDNRNDDVQLCCQALLLEEHLGRDIPHGYVYYASSHQRRQVYFSQELRELTLATIREAQTIIRMETVPEPLGDQRCQGCSLAARCLPEETKFLQGSGETPVRPLPAINLGRTLYVDTPGAYLRKRQERLLVTKDNDIVKEVPLCSIEQVIIVGTANMSTQLTRLFLEKGIQVFYFSGSRGILGWLNPAWGKNVPLRLAQYRACHDEALCLELAKTMIKGKISNMRTFLLRYNRARPDSSLEEAAGQLEKLAGKTGTVQGKDSLRGIEGAASRAYFQVFGRLLGEKVSFDFKRRNRRPPKDPVNALLSFGYSLLVKEAVAVCQSVGLDPYLGFFHSMVYGRPALALDLVEEFRTIIVDSVVTTCLNKGIINPEHFEERLGGCFLNEAGRKRFFSAYQGRMNEEVTHPIFTYRLPYRRTMELQGRFLAKVLQGELPAYKPFLVR